MGPGAWNIIHTWYMLIDGTQLLKGNFSWKFHFFCHKHQKSHKGLRKEWRRNTTEALTENQDFISSEWKVEKWVDENEKAIRGKENMSQIKRWDWFANLTRMNVEEDSELCQVLRAKLKETPPLKFCLQNTISPSIGGLFFTFHRDCCKFFSLGHQMGFFSASELASYSH